MTLRSTPTQYVEVSRQAQMVLLRPAALSRCKPLHKSGNPLPILVEQPHSLKIVMIGAVHVAKDLVSNSLSPARKGPRLAGKYGWGVYQ
jgi:hypothetical protein